MCRARIQHLRSTCSCAARRLVLFDTCGVSHVVRRTPLEQVASWHYEVHRAGSGGFGAAFATLAGGEYRLCWCAAGFACSVAPHFVVEAGSVVVVGPAPLHQDRTCIAGQSCALEGLVGRHLADGDSIMAADTCGVALTSAVGPLQAPLWVWTG